MFRNLLVAFSLIFLLSNCRTVPTEGTQDDMNTPTDQPVQQEDYSMDYQPQDPQNFDVLEGEQAATELNQQTQKEIEEVEVPDRVLFDLDSTSLVEEAKATLQTQSEWLMSDPAINITVEGHCDERGTREYNIALGEKRAASVKNYLVSLGVDSSRISTVSYGKERPAFVGTGEEIWSKNRRAVTVVK